MNLSSEISKPELILACQVSSSFKTTKKLESALAKILNISVHSFEFWRAALVLIRDGKPPVWWYAKNNFYSIPENEEVHWEALYAHLNQSETKEDKLLKSLNPAAYITIPVILQAGDPVGTMEVGIFSTDSNTAEYMLNKALSLGRHIADIIQESVFETQKDRQFRKLAAWLEVISTISSTLDIRQVLHVVAQLTADLFLARSCIYMLDEKGETLIPNVAVGSYDVKLKEKFKALKNYPLFPAIRLAIKSQRPVIITPKNIKKYIPINMIEDFNYSWMVLVPIIKMDKILGIMQVDRPYGPKGFDYEETEIIFAIARATAIAVENARLVEMLSQKELLLHQLVNKIITAQEDERKRLASDLHDGIIQSLIGIWYRLQRISPNSNKDPEKWYKDITDVTDLLGEQIQDIRRILYDLRPVILDNYGLIPSIQSFSEKVQEQHNLQINLVLLKENMRFPPKIEITLFRIFQEVITNVIKHSGATKVKVCFDVNNEIIKLLIKDNGSGLCKCKLCQPQKLNGLGLASIQERALLLNGTCNINSEPGQGTQVLVQIPLNAINY